MASSQTAVYAVWGTNSPMITRTIPIMKMNIVAVKLPADGKVPVDASVVANPETAAVFGLGEGEGAGEALGVGFGAVGPPTALGDGLGEGEGDFAWAKG